MSVRFAISGMDRSGTQWLAELLDTDPTVQVLHEPDCLKARDAQMLAMARRGTLDARMYARQRYNLWRRLTVDVVEYAEVNALIRYYLSAIREVWGVPVAALARDGYATCRSCHHAGYFQKAGVPPGIMPPAEHAGEPWACCCWYWADAYGRLSAQEVPVYRLEDLNARYSTVEVLGAAMGCHVTHANWTLFAGRRVHASGAWRTELTPAQQATFNEIAGEVQDALGYDVRL